MVMDRPFFFVIADSQTQTILFMGIVNNPVP
jgi:serine protease inhibitor